MGWDSAQALLNVQATFTSKDCSKTLINDICDWKTPWLGDSAQWLETCANEATPQTVNIANTELIPAVSSSSTPSSTFLGGLAIDGPGCWWFAEWSEWPPYFTSVGNSFAAQAFIKMLGEENKKNEYNFKMA